MSVFPSFSAGADIVFGSLAQSSKINDIKSPIETFISALAGGSVLSGDHTSATNITANKNPIVFINASGGNATVNLPSAGSHSLFPIWIQKTDESFNTVTINRNGSDTINNPWSPLQTAVATSIVLRLPREGVLVYPSGTTWRSYSPTNNTGAIRFRAKLTSNYVLTGSSTVVQFNVVSGTNLYNIGSAFDITNYRFVAPFDGHYVFSTNLPTSAVAIDTFGIFTKNGTHISNLDGRNNANTPLDTGGTTSVELATGDYVDVRATGNTRQVQAATAIFNGYLVRRLA